MVIHKVYIKVHYDFPLFSFLKRKRRRVHIYHLTFFIVLRVEMVCDQENLHFLCT
jgi:hypothetical protein